MPLRLEDTDDELQLAVYESLYASREQKMRRFNGILLLTLKHGLRGVLFSWPLYMLALAALLLPAASALLFVVLLIPAVAVSGYILLAGIKEDFQQHIYHAILERGDIAKLWFRSKA